MSKKLALFYQVGPRNNLMPEPKSPKSPESRESPKVAKNRPHIVVGPIVVKVVAVKVAHIVVVVVYDYSPEVVIVAEVVRSERHR